MFNDTPARPEKIALFAVRACDLAAYGLQKKHFSGQRFPDPWLKQRSEELFIVAVHGRHPSSNCFCASTGDGPEATENYDLAMYELDDGYVISAGSEAGEDVIHSLQLDPASSRKLRQCAEQIQQATRQQSRRMPVHQLKQVLPQQHDEVVTTTATASHYRDWSSCFSHNHGYLAGYQLRPDSWQRYRQWLTQSLPTGRTGTSALTLPVVGAVSAGARQLLMC